MKGTPSLGFNYLLRGLKLITQPGLRLFVLIPLAINIIIFAVLVGLSLHQISELINGFMNWLPDWGWLDFIRWILWPLAVGMILTVVMYTFSIIANMIAAPFNGLLAEKAEELLTGQPVDGYETIGQAIAGFPKSISREILKLLYYLPLALVVLILTFIPVINIAAPVFWFVLGAWMMSIQYCDYPADNNLHNFGAIKKALRQQRLSASGFGAGAMLGTMIPVVNFIIMPVAVCGATVFWVEELKGVVEGADS